jgi:ABC-type transport system involved in multi-copper enzyme maturation permease subunit
MSFSLQQLGAGFLLLLLQGLAAVPWILVFNWTTVKNTFRSQVESPEKLLGFWLLGGFRGLYFLVLVVVAVVVGVGGVVPAFFFGLIQDRDTLTTLGRIYAAVLELQLAVDLIVAAFGLLLLVWPKGAAVALSAFREGIRQPMFWLLFGFGVVLMGISPFIPYFTFGEDHKMVEELGYDTIMAMALLFGVLAASMSISEEIEGRTAVTLMSKPVSRRQFLLGKFAGILLAGVAMTVLLGWWFDWVLLYKRWYDRVDPEVLPAPVSSYLHAWMTTSGVPDFVRGIELWSMEAGRALPGLVLGFCHVMVLLAVAVSLATRLPMIVNLVICLGIYFGGHLTPVLVGIASDRARADNGSPVSRMLLFMAELFNTILPGLDFFGLGTAVTRDSPLDVVPFLTYVGSVVLYGVLYTLIVLVFGLILFEDRDLA